MERNVALYDSRGYPGVSSRAHGLHFAAYALDLAKNSHQVPTKNLLDIFAAVASVEQRLGNFRQVRSGIDALRRGATDSIEI